MALQYADRRTIGGIIMDAWQNELQTEMDPASGRWFTNDPDGGGGLYGALTDELATALVFSAEQKTFTRSQISVATAIADNRNGLTPEQSVTLEYSFQNTSTTTHSQTDSLMVGVSRSMTGRFDALVVALEGNSTFSTEYTHSWTEETSTATSETQTFTQSIPVRGIPTGRVYQVVLLANKDNLQIPYRADIYLTGKSTARFASPVNGKSTWSVDAGTLCEWISRYGSAGAASHRYSRDPLQPTRGRFSTDGLLTASRTVNFTARTSDITDAEAVKASRNGTDADLSAGQSALTSGRPVAEVRL